MPRSYQVRSLVFTTAAFQRQLEATVTINVVTDMPDQGIDFRADLGADGVQWKSRPRRLADLVVGGVACYHLRGRLTNGRPNDEYGGYWNGGIVWVSVESSQSPPSAGC
ncbi:MAG: hypothetical protein R2734_04630 [Nocardioides sp.]